MHLFILILLMVASLQSASAKDVGDVHDELTKQFPGKIISVSQDNGQFTITQFSDTTTEEEKTEINGALATIDKSAPGKTELNQQVTAKADELTEPANNPKVSDEDYEALWIKVQAKLDRARRLTDLAKKQEKIDEAAVLIEATATAAEAKEP